MSQYKTCSVTFSKPDYVVPLVVRILTGWMANTLPTGKVEHAAVPDGLGFYAVRSLHANWFVLKMESGEAMIFDAGYWTSGKNGLPWELGNWFCCRKGDAKYKGSLHAIGLDPSRVTVAAMTHSDIDHVGGLPVFENAAVYMGEGERPLVEGEVEHFKGLKAARITGLEYLKDGDQIRFGDYVATCFSTPGHTDGSVSYEFRHLNDSGKVLIFIGDAFFTDKKGHFAPRKLEGIHMHKEQVPGAVDIVLQRCAAIRAQNADANILIVSCHTGLTDYDTLAASPALQESKKDR